MAKHMHFAYDASGYPVMLADDAGADDFDFHNYLDKHSAAGVTRLPLDELDHALAGHTRIYDDETYYSRAACLRFRHESDERAALFSTRFDFEPEQDDPGSEGWIDKQQAADLLDVPANLLTRKTWGRVGVKASPSGELLFSKRDLRALPAGSLGYRHSG